MRVRGRSALKEEKEESCAKVTHRDLFLIYMYLKLFSIDLPTRYSECNLYIDLHIKICRYKYMIQILHIYARIKHAWTLYNWIVICIACLHVKYTLFALHMYKKARLTSGSDELLTTSSYCKKMDRRKYVYQPREQLCMKEVKSQRPAKEKALFINILFFLFSPKMS